MGHSMGGFDAVMLGDDSKVAGYVLISAADMGKFATRVTGQATMTDEASYTNASVDSLVDDARAHAVDWNWNQRAALLAPRPVLILTSDDGLAKTGEAAAIAIRTAGKTMPTVIHMTTDHSFNDHRVSLAAAVTDWLARTFLQR